MKPRVIYILVGLAVLAIVVIAIRYQRKKNDVVVSSCIKGQFVSSRDRVPENWTGPVFQLSQDYPDAPPERETLPWDAIDYKARPFEYMMAIRDYIYEGNLDPNDPNAPWKTQENPIRKWYHAPWMDAGNNGREFIHGLTKELVSRPGQIAPNPPQSQRIQNWAVGFYNPPGGYVIGQVWCNPQQPNLAASLFPDGTVSAKLLFTAAAPEQVPFVANSVEWTANINTSPDIREPLDRTPQTVRLLQMDIAVRDKRDETTGWLFGTFIYDPKAGNENPWENMQPVGLMWGNDPTVTPGNGLAIEESWLNPETADLMQHYGWAGRLNGPVDNPNSSCLSCHATAGWPVVSLIPPNNATDQERLQWFRNVMAGSSFDPSQVSLDYSLQLAYSIQNFYRENGAPGQGVLRSDGSPMPEVNRSGETSPDFIQDVQKALELTATPRP